MSDPLIMVLLFTTHLIRHAEDLGNRGQEGDDQSVIVIPLEGLEEPFTGSGGQVVANHRDLGIIISSGDGW